MDNTTNIIYNIKAIDNATSTINSVMSSLAALKAISKVTVTIKTINETQNRIKNSLTETYKTTATANLKVVRTLQDNYKQTATYTTNINNNVKNTNTNLNKTVNSTKQAANNTKQTATNAQTAGNYFKKWATNISSFLKQYLNVRRIANYLVDCVQESSALTETLHLMGIAFGSAKDEAYEFGQTISEAFGTSLNEVYEYLSVFRQMTDAIGIADDTATKMSKSLTALGYDIASLYNISISSAMEKLEAGIAGQTKPLRTLGMDITAQSLDNYLKEELRLSNITSKQMTQADKMILRTIVIMEQAQNTYGDVAETINEFAGQVKTLQGAFENFKLAIGDLVEAYFKPVVTYAAALLIALTKIIRVFVGIDTSSLEEASSSLSTIDEELEDIEETTGLLSFDKFNALSSSDSTDSSSITDILTEVFNEKYTEYMTEFEEQLNSINNAANQVAQKFIQWIFPDATFDDAGNLITDINGINNGLGEVNGWLKLIWAVIKAIVAIKITTMLAKLPAALEAISASMATAVTTGTALKAVISNLFLAIAALTFVDLITQWKDLDAWGKTWRITLILVTAAVWAYNTSLLTTCKTMVTTAITAIAQLVTALKVTLVKAISVVVIEFNVLKVKITTTVIPAIIKFITYLKTLATTIVTKVCSAFLSFASSGAGLTVGLATLCAGIVYFISNLNNMSSTAKVLIPIIAALAAVFTGLAVAHAAAKAGLAAPVMAGVTAAALAAGIVLAAGTAIAVASYAQGGLPEEGQLFIANEAGPELVGNIGGNTAVANNEMIVTALESAAYKGFLRAIDDSGVNASRSSGGTAVFNINGREFARATATDMASEFSRRNLKIK